ncbi:MAG: hypothetical protein K6F64_08990 [Clostridia bacterium]|nr:hypothetical protein [Clostridia bacterium]
MSEIEKRNMPKAYIGLWALITAAYGIWMTFFMREIVLDKYETVEQRTVDGYTYPDITGMTGRHWLYPVWVIVSCITLLLFIVYIRKILYADRLTSAIKWICLIGCVAGCIYVFAYGFFDTVNKQLEPATLMDKVKYITASMIGLMYPWWFRGWGVIAGATVFMNTMYAYRKYNYNSKVGVILGSLGSAAIYLTINCPSMGDDDKDFSIPRCSVHWAGALLFAVCCAAPLIIFLFSKARKEKGRFLGGLIIFGLLLIVMLVLLITVGKSAIIENIPMIAAYVLLFIINFTDFFGQKQSEAQ